MKVPTSLCATPGLPEAWGPICQAGPGLWGIPASPLIVHALPQQQPRRCGHAAGRHRGRHGSEMDAAPRWRAARDGRAQVGGPRPWEETAPLPGSPASLRRESPAPCTAAAQQNPSASLCCFIKPRPNFSQRVLSSNADGKVASSAELCVLLGGLCPEPTVLSWLASISVGFQMLTGPLRLGVYEPIPGPQQCGLLVPREAAFCWGAQASIRARCSRGKDLPSWACEQWSLFAMAGFRTPDQTRGDWWVEEGNRKSDDRGELVGGATRARGQSGNGGGVGTTQPSSTHRGPLEERLQPCPGSRSNGAAPPPLCHSWALTYNQMRLRGVLRSFVDGLTNLREHIRIWSFLTFRNRVTKP